MTIRARARRARPYNAPRAVVRHRPAPYPEETLVRTSRRIDSAADLSAWCQAAGYRTRPTSSGGTLVFGPIDTALVPSRWDPVRGRKNVLRSLRAAGLDLSPLDADEDQHLDDDRAPTPADLAKLVVPNRPRPTLAYTKTDTDPKEPAVTADAVIPSPRPDVTLDDLVELSDRLDEYKLRLDSAEAELARLRKEVAAGRPITDKEQADQRRRTAILGVLQQLPPGFRLTSGVITANLAVVDESEARAYRATITDMVVEGALVQHGGNPNGRGGSHAQYALPSQDAAAQVAS